MQVTWQDGTCLVYMNHVSMKTQIFIVKIVYKHALDTFVCLLRQGSACKCCLHAPFFDSCIFHFPSSLSTEFMS